MTVWVLMSWIWVVHVLMCFRDLQHSEMVIGLIASVKRCKMSDISVLVLPHIPQFWSPLFVSLI